MFFLRRSRSQCSSVYYNSVCSMQYCIPPILVEVLAPHFAVRYSCRSVLVFLGSFVLFCLPFWLRCGLRVLR